MFTKLARKQEGFTLIELLVVVAIIALLAAFAVPRLFSAMDTARKAPGQADIQTVADSLERYFVEPTNRKYPTSASADNATQITDIKNALVGTYLKNGTTFKNGYGKGFGYITNASGKYFFLVDPRKVTGAVKVACGAVSTYSSLPLATTTTVWVSPALTLGSDFAVAVAASADASPTTDLMKQGCVVGKWTGTAWGTQLTGVSGTEDQVQLVTF